MEICFCGIVPWGSQPNFTAIIYASRAANCKKTAKIGHILVSKSNSKDWYKPEAVLVLRVTRGHYGWCHLTEDKISYIFFTQTHIHTRLTALFLGLPRWAGTRKVKTYLDFTEARDSEWQWHQLALCKSAPCFRQTTTPAPHHSVFYRPDANQQHQSTEGNYIFFRWNYMPVLRRFGVTEWKPSCRKQILLTVKVEIRDVKRQPENR